MPGPDSKIHHDGLDVLTSDGEKETSRLFRRDKQGRFKSPTSGTLSFERRIELARNKGEQIMKAAGLTNPNKERKLDHPVDEDGVLCTASAGDGRDIAFILDGVAGTVSVVVLKGEDEDVH